MVTPFAADYGEHVYHLYAIQVGNRDALREQLGSEGVQTGIHYPIPLHLQPAYADLGYERRDFPVSESYAARTLSLPMYAELTEEQVGYVVDRVKEFAG